MTSVPARSGQAATIYFENRPRHTVWDVYGLDQKKVAHLEFGASAAQSWQTAGIPPGLYYVRLRVEYMNGKKNDLVRKILIRP